jgi:flagellar protein FliL
MSTAATAAIADAKLPAKGKKKKLILIIAAVAVLVLGAGGAALFVMKKNAAAAAEAAEADDEDGQTVAHKKAAAAHKHDPKAMPVFVPLEPFTVNLADRDAERYAQVGVTLEIPDAKVGEQIKSFMPAIRNNVLLAIADRTAAELLGRDGKAKLADKIKRETARALGVEVEDEAGADAAHSDSDEKAENKAEKKASAKKKKKKTAEPEMPVKAVHFSNFIIQ